VYKQAQNPLPDVGFLQPPCNAMRKFIKSRPGGRHQESMRLNRQNYAFHWVRPTYCITGRLSHLRPPRLPDYFWKVSKCRSASQFSLPIVPTQISYQPFEGFVKTI